MIICPKCKEKLSKVERTYRCKNNHSFDISKSGYLNLLLDNQKNSKNPGDDKDMVKSRELFLKKDYYKSISEKLNEILKEELDFKKENLILDIGCGEGYYTGNLKEYLNGKNVKSKIYGVDISKEAILKASKKYKSISWLVSSALSLNLEKESFNAIICMFSKIVPSEKMKVLKKGGKVIIVSSGKDHLIELKEVVYDKVRYDFYSPVEEMKEFKFISNKNLKDEVLIKENENIKNLFNMTPYRWKSPKEGVEKLFKLNSIKVTIDVNFYIFEKI